MGKTGYHSRQGFVSGPVNINLERGAMADYQTQIIESKHKYIILACATKTGKTYCLAQKALETMINGGRVIWIASTFKRSGMIYDTLTKSLADVAKVSRVAFNRTYMTLEIEATGGSMGCYSGDTRISVEAAMGDGAQLVVIDEASRCDEASWDVATSVTSSTGGQICVALNVDKSPRVSWAVRMYAEHINSSDPDPDFLVLSLTAEQSPYITKVELERARKNTPLRTFNALYNNIIPAEDDHAVFSKFENCIEGVLENPKPNHKYIMGVDPARSHDYTVMCVIDRDTRSVVGWERTHNLPWQKITQNILDMASKWNNAHVVIDATAQQTLLLETLQRHNIDVEPFYFTGKSKPRLIEKLMTDIEGVNIHFPSIPELVYELHNYSVSFRANGYLDYGAMEGFHDDCVTALALANYKLRTGPKFDALTFRAQYVVGQTTFGTDRDSLTIM